MASGSGNVDGNRNGNENEEFVVYSVKDGMKREFARMMQAHAKSGIIMGQRVTRSQNSPSNNLGTAKIGKNENKGVKRLKGLGMKKKKKGDKVELAEEGKKVEEIIDIELVGDKGEKAGLVSEEEETKNDIVDGNSNDERKKNWGQVRLEEVMVILEKQGSDVEKIGDDDVAKEGSVKELTDGMVECVNEDLVEIREEKRVRVDSDRGAEEAVVILEVKSGVEDAVGILEDKCEGADVVAAYNVGADVLSDNGVSVKTYFRRFPRSTLKPEVEAVEEPKAETLEQSGTERVKDEEPRGSNSIVSVPTSSKLDLKKMPTKLKELLETGLLEGLPVRYVRGSRVSKPGESGLEGVVQGSGILCFCDDCKATQVVTPNQFEVHAGSGNKRPPQYIYLENGKSLRDILNVCKEASSDSLELAVQNAIRHSVAKSTFCLNCRGSMPQAGPGETMICESCSALRKAEHHATQSRDTSARSSLPVSSSMSSSKMSSSSRPGNKGKARLTKKDLRLHKLVFESNLLADGTPLDYYVRGKKLQSGHKLGSGIFCHCCNQVVSPSVFEAHAGCVSRRKPYLQIYTSDGISLHEWSLAIKKNSLACISTDESDDVCSICEGMGELLCCDMCPRAFHKECVNLPCIPEGNWYCSYCVNMFQREKFAGHNANAVAAGRVAGIDPIEEVKKRCIRVIGALEPQVGGCVLCSGHDFIQSGFGPRTIMLCDQCDKEYHVGCLKEHGIDELKELPNEDWFCSRECSSIHSALQQLVNDGEKPLPDFLLNVIKKKHEDSGSEDNSEPNISWRLFHGKMASEESRKWLCGAISIFRDRFDTIGYPNRSHNDLIPFMIYGRSNRDQDFGRMYCAVLIVNSIVVSAGIFRIFGQDVAEIPLVATSTNYQGKGYFQSLFCCFENFLASVNVKALVLPATPQAESIWMNKFGFKKMRAEQLKQYQKYYQMVPFHGTTILHKASAKLEPAPS